MVLTPEMITTLVAVITLLLGIGGMIAQVSNKLTARIDRVDTKVDQLNDKIDTKVDQLNDKIDTKVDQLELKLSARIDALGERVGAVEHEVSDLKVSVARLEGPTPTLVRVR